MTAADDFRATAAYQSAMRYCAKTGAALEVSPTPRPTFLGSLVGVVLFLAIALTGIAAVTG